MLTSHVRWQPGQPDNLGGQQNCLHLRILTNVSQTVISDRNCTSKFPIACQVEFLTHILRPISILGFEFNSIKRKQCRNQILIRTPSLSVRIKAHCASAMYDISNYVYSIIIWVFLQPLFFRNSSGLPTFISIINHKIHDEFLVCAFF
jgi:hypothetical protein